MQSKNKNKNKNKISVGSSCHLKLLGLSRMAHAVLDCDSSGMLLQNYACLCRRGVFFQPPTRTSQIPSIFNNTKGLLMANFKIR
jgi:hypothetical protein